MVIQTWSLPPTPRPPARDTPVDIVIVTYDEDLDIAEPTVVGALAVRGRTEIHLCDDGHRPEMQAMAERHGIRYVTRSDNMHAKAGNINAVLPSLEGELLLVLDADHVASPDILEAMTGYFSDESTVLVQSAHSFRNHNSVIHHESGRHEQSLFFDVLLPGRNRLHSVFWCGSAAIIRLSALRAVGGIATTTSTEDFETSLLLQKSGYSIRYHNEHLIQGLAPDNLASYAVQRARWAEGTLSAFHWRLRLPFGRGLRPSQRLSYVGTLLHYLTPVQRLVFVVYVVLVGLFALIPVAMPGPAGVAFWGAWMLLSAFTATALHRGVSGRVEGVRSLLLSLEPHLRALPALVTRRPLRFTVTPKNEPDLGGWGAVRLVRVPLVVAVVLGAVLVARGADLLLRQLGGEGMLPPLELLAGTTSQCVDLHQGGGAFIVPRDLGEFAHQLEFSVECRTLDRGAKNAHGILTITSRSAIGPSGAMMRVGGSVSWRDAESRDVVIAHCYVVEPYQARNRVWTRSAARMPVAITARLGIAESMCVDVSIGGAAFLTSETALGLHELLPIELVLSTGEQVRGEFRIRHIAPSASGLMRIGGSAEWSHTAWLARYGAVVHTVDTRPRRARRLSLQ
jgi:cellulose synthase (UDP-forming)